MRIGALLLTIALVASPASALFGRGGGHHGMFGGGGHHGHSINAWMGSHRPKLR